jgi:hypothetical protein
MPSRPAKQGLIVYRLNITNPSKKSTKTVKNVLSLRFQGIICSDPVQCKGETP